MVFSLKQADDTTFYRPSFSRDQSDLVGEAIGKATDWSSKNSMLLNPDKTVVMNTSLSHMCKYDCDILVNGVTMTPATEAKFLLLTTSLILTTILTTRYQKPTVGLF